MTVTDATGRVLFRRAATEAEIAEALAVAEDADAEAQAELARIAERRALREQAELEALNFDHGLESA